MIKVRRIQWYHTKGYALNGRFYSVNALKPVKGAIAKLRDRYKKIHCKAVSENQIEWIRIS